MPSDLSRVEIKEEGNLLIEAVSLLVQRQHESEGWIAEQIWQAEERAAAAERRSAELEARLTGIEEHLARLAEDIEPVRGDAGVEERLARLREQVEGLKSTSDARATGRTDPILLASVGPSAAPGDAEPATVTRGDIAARSQSSVPTHGEVADRSETRPLVRGEGPGRGEAFAVGRGEVTSRGDESTVVRGEVLQPEGASSRRGAQRTSLPSPRVAASAPAQPTRVAATAQASSFWELLGPSPQDRFGFLLIGAGAVAIVWAILTQIRFA